MPKCFNFPSQLRNPFVISRKNALDPIGKITCACTAAEFDASVLGADFKYVRPPRPEFMGLGGMMVNRNELNALLNPFSSGTNFMTTMKVVLPYFLSRLRFLVVRV